MRVVVNTIEEFCSEIACSNVVGKTVRFRVDRIAEQDEAITFLVGVWATAVIAEDSGNVYLLEFGDTAGYDNANGDVGTDVAAHWEVEVLAACHKAGLEVRPGKIEVA